MAVSVSVCRWLWLISQPAFCGPHKAVVSALKAGLALCSNVGNQLKSSLLGMWVPRDSRVPWAGWRRALSCPVSWSVYHWMASFSAELAISSLITCLCFSSPGERGNGHLLAGRKDICCSPQRGLWHCCPHFRTRVNLIPGIINNEYLYNSA